VTDADLWRAWGVWTGVAALVVVIAAALLVTIWLTARRILADAGRALTAAQAIRAQTQPIWALATTNELAEDILRTVQAIDEQAALLADALAAKEVRR